MLLGSIMVCLSHKISDTLDMKCKIAKNIKDAGPSAESKAKHYTDALDKQLIALRKTEEMIYLLQEPAVRREI